MLQTTLTAVFMLLIIFAILAVIAITKKNIHIWLYSYLTQKTEVGDPNEAIHILFAFCDHYEPQWSKATYEEEVSRVDRWCADYPKLVESHTDADGCYPKHSFFYPEEEYREEHLAKLTTLCELGYGEVEIHLHHDNDTAENLTQTLSGFLKTLDTKHGLIATNEETGAYQFSFIHGNWALDNSSHGVNCGIDNELAVLANCGCYADFTLPSAPSETQTAKINSIYYAKGVDGKSKSHNTGVDLQAGVKGEGDLVIIQGPLCLNWQNRKLGIMPRIENSDIRSNSPPTKQRVDLWVNCGIQVKGQPQWRFIKIHTHGTQETDMDTLLGKPTDEMFDYLETKYNDGEKYILHYVSAREMYNIVKAAEAGEKGDPNQYRDFEITKPPYLAKRQNND